MAKARIMPTTDSRYLHVDLNVLVPMIKFNKSISMCMFIFCLYSVHRDDVLMRCIWLDGYPLLSYG